MIALVVGVAYLLLAQYVLWLNDPVYLGAGFWPSAGVSLAALLLLPTRRWGWVLGAVGAAELLGDTLHGYPLAASLWWTAGNVVEPLVGAALIRWFTGASSVLVPVRHLIGFLALGVVAGPLVGASIGSVGTIWGMGTPFWQVWPKYVVGDALGVLVVAPVILAVRERPTTLAWREGATLFAGLTVVTVAAFRNWAGPWDLVLPYLVVPFLIWAALRSGVRGTAWAVLLVANVANAATAFGYGPFALAGGPTGHAVTLLQIFLVITSSTALILAALVNDLLSREELERRLVHQAAHDTLTGLPNRKELLERAEVAVAELRRDRGLVGVLFCDLDGFKAVNDDLGHEAGDRVLVEVAERLHHVLRPGDVIGRFGGDEFVMLCTGLHGGADAIGVAERVLRALASPFELEGRRYLLGASIGVVVSGDPDLVADELIREADAAMYRAKQRGGNCYHLARIRVRQAGAAKRGVIEQEGVH